MSRIINVILKCSLIPFGLRHDLEFYNHKRELKRIKKKMSRGKPLTYQEHEEYEAYSLHWRCYTRKEMIADLKRSLKQNERRPGSVDWMFSEPGESAEHLLSVLEKEEMKAEQKYYMEICNNHDS